MRLLVKIISSTFLTALHTESGNGKRGKTKHVATVGNI